MKDHFSLYNRQQSNQICFLEQISDREFWDYAQSLANLQDAPPVTGAEVLECQIEQGCCLFPLRALREVIAPPHKLTHLPLSPPWMSGITVWRGHVIPVVDLASYLLMHQKDELGTMQHTYSLSNSMLLILDEANVLLGLQLALVGSMITLEQAQLVSPAEAPLWYPRHLLTTLQGVYNGSVLLNPQALINQMINQMNVGAADE